MKPPVIKVEIIHIEGPLKGTIQEFFDPLIEIGRHPDCHVCFPKDMSTISRKHLEIRREGNRFMAIDHSTNGTLVNGKAIQEIMLKDGDVLTISENGPKISIITTVVNEDELPPVQTEKKPTSVSLPDALNRNENPEESVMVPDPGESLTPETPSVTNHKPDSSYEASMENVQKSLIIQCGAKIMSFQTLPIVLGCSESCDFKLEHPSILAQHAQFHFYSGSYQIKDLTGRGMITINGEVVSGQAPLEAGAMVSLSDRGPEFQFLGDGRLAEIDSSGSTSGQGASNPAPGSNAKNEGVEKKSFWPFAKK